MPTGKLAISRGHPIGGSASASRAQAPTPGSPEYQLVHDRLNALERLGRLLELGVLSADEFVAEKAFILKLPADELVLRQPVPDDFDLTVRGAAPRGPSLLGRLLTLKFLPVGVAVGLALSFASQPQETVRFFDEALSLIGA